MNLSHHSAERVRALALGLFVFAAVAAAIVWFVVRPYGSQYFFPVYFLLAFGVPFAFYAIGASHGWLLGGMLVTAVGLVWLNLWGYRADGVAPRTLDWSNALAGLTGLALAWGVQRMQSRARRRHHPQHPRE